MSDAALNRGESAEAALRRILSTPNADMVGELLRDLTFVGEGFGCYSTFDVREDASEWDEEGRRSYWSRYWGSDAYEYSPGELDELIDEAVANGRGFTWWLGPFCVDCCWYWDGDGTLSFRVSDSFGNAIVAIENTDCKKDYRWKILELAA